MISLSVIEELRAEGSLVEVRRGRFGDRDTGFIVRTSPEFIVLSVVDANCSFDGTTILQVSDVTQLEWGTNRLKARSSVLAESPSSPDVVNYLDLSSWESIVRSVSAREPVLSFHCEGIGGDRVDIGMKARMDGESVRADNLTVDGTIEGEFALDLDEVTRLDFGGGYELAVWRMHQTVRGE